MFVDAPRRTTDGLTTTPQFTGNIDRPIDHYYPNLDSAKADKDSAPTLTSFAGWTAGTYRESMTNGIVGYKKYVDTSYRALYVRTYREQDYIHVHQVAPDKFYLVRRPLGWNYDGMSGSGCGSPFLQFEPGGPNGKPSAIANRAIMANLQNRAEVECLNKARDQKLDLAETMVDIGKTIGMVAERAAQVISAYRHARAGRLGEAARVLGLHKRQIARRGVKGNTQAIARGWLEMQYGWRPLLNDIYNGVRAVNEGLERDPNIAHVTRRLTEGLPFVERDVADAWAAETLSASVQCDIEVKYRFKVTDANLAYLTSIGLDNPLYILWVAKPMTFVVDWLIPVSDWLQSVSAPLGLTFVSGYCSTRVHGTVSIRRDRLHNGALPFSQPAKGRAEFVFLRRQVYSSFPVPKLYFRFPFSTWERAVSAVALFITANRSNSGNNRLIGD